MIIPMSENGASKTDDGPWHEIVAKRNHVGENRQHELGLRIQVFSVHHMCKRVRIIEVIWENCMLN